MKDLAGKTAVVTGAASGIGLGMTEVFVAEGMKVVMADVDEAAVVKEASRLQADGADVRAVPTDVSRPEQVEALRDEAVAEYGAVHVVCNNAGVGPVGPMLTTTADDWKWTVGVNLLGVAYGVLAFAPLLKEQGEGHVVNTASEAGVSSSAVLGMYTATKHGVVGLTESLFYELQGTGVGVSVLCPNLVNTKIFDAGRNWPAGRELNPEENSTQSMLREMLTSTGMAPAQVGSIVVDAIKENRFWVFPHGDLTLNVALRRFEDLKAGRNPTGAYG